MIIEKFKTKPTTGWPSMCRNKNKLQQFRSMCLIDPDYAFPNIEAFRDRAVWIQGIKDRKIIPIIDIRNVNPKTVDTEYETGDDEITIKTRNGRYIFTLLYHVDFEFHKTIRKYSEQYFDVIFVDWINQALAYSPDGTMVKGFDINLLNIEDQDMGDNKLKFSPVYVELSDSRQYNDFGIVEKMDFELNKLNLVQVEIYDISGTSNEISFKVRDEVYGFEIAGLDEIQFQDITNGNLSYSVFRENQNGGYFAQSFNAPLTSGSIVVDEDGFYGVAQYQISAIAGQIYDIAVSATQLDFKFRDAGSLVPITGLTFGDITLFDSVNGGITGILTELSPGSYRVTNPTSTFWNGDIDINNGNYEGSGNYQTIRSVDIINISATSATDIAFSVRDSLESIAITNLLQAELGFVDDTNGALTITGFTNLGGGQYSAQVALPGMTTGAINISSNRYAGTSNYSTAISVTLTVVDITDSSEMIISLLSGGSPYPIVGNPFTLTDNNHGTFQPFAIDDLGGGEHRLYLSKGRTSGTIVFDDGAATDAATYNYTGPWIVNCGAADTTDWDNAGSPVPGLANGMLWIGNVGDTFLRRSAGDGFSSPAQRAFLQYANGFKGRIIKRLNYYEAGKTYKLRFRYRSIGDGLYVEVSEWQAFLENDTYPRNEGNAVLVETTPFTPSGARFLQVSFQNSDFSGDITIEIDELELIEV